MSVDELRKLRKKIEKAAEEEGSSEALLENLQKLKTVAVSRSLIKDSKIGKALGKLRKHSNENVSSICSGLVSDWKKILEEDGKSVSEQSDNVKSEQSETKKRKKDDDNGSVKKEEKDTKKSKSEKKDESKKVSITEDDKTREKGVEVLASALGAKKDSDTLDVEDVAREIEEELFKIHKSCDKNYKTKLRSLCFNIKNPKNPELRDSLLTGVLASAKLVVMSPADMASEEMKKQRQKTLEYFLEASKAKQPNATPTGMFKCSKCGKRETTYFQLQTRSADEPMTTFHHCTNCGHRW
eukprot:CAMPEP_0168561284 /NCGR_PEP_ID=MMETSP0413-20121227/11514_1 /TAXON_ID=136452 /ORGANISM="Filamoeba nolandi, Strain NC-AS-23-1" /LENGTH=296 /DNA_ID=CAMNT_0008592647 /DNA_START=18 /DNA_END=905 /DNA_ORIENTATION=-